MHPRLAPLAADIERQRAALLATIAGHPDAALGARPAPEAWSPAQILDHLAVVEANVARLLAKRLMRAKEAGLGPETSDEPVQSALETAYLTQKIDAPENVRPAPDVSPAAALERLGESHAELRVLFGAADGYDLSCVMARHQIFGELDMYEWLVFLARHEQRHVAQVVRALAGSA